uniref:Putative secreted protein n=1 Tax=Anopheles darlingi TaxID=43151 RepID=A0A2M4D220_ANODA
MRRMRRSLAPLLILGQSLVKNLFPFSICNHHRVSQSPPSRIPEQLESLARKQKDKRFGRSWCHICG